MSFMAYNSAGGLGGMLKQGTRHFSQEDQPADASVVLRSIHACLELCQMLQSSLGPNSRCKLVQNHLGKLMVTSDCASILKELDVEHPAAKLLAQAAQKQHEECGDHTHTVLAFAGELLWQTSQLILYKMTWQPAPEIRAGYQRALQLVQEQYLNDCVCDTVDPVNDKDQLLKLLKPVLATKQQHYATESILAPLVADACLYVMEQQQQDSTNGRQKNRLNVQSVRTVKILGSSVRHSTLVKGYVVTRKRGGGRVETVVTSADDAKVAVYASGVEASSTEAKGTVVMKTAEDLKEYNRSEERKMQEIIQGIAEAGVKIVVSGGNVSDMAMHFLDKFDLMCIKVSSKWELRRLCQAVGATALVRLGTPMPDELGHCSTVRVQEIGDQTVTVLESASSKLATLVLRASTTSVLDDLERAVDNGLQAVAQAAQVDGRLLYGGGAVEMTLATRLQEEAQRTPGLEQYALQAFGQALTVVPRILAENAGCNAAQVVADLGSVHAACIAKGENCSVGVDIDAHDDSSSDKEGEDGLGTGLADMKKKGVVDLYSSKLSALKLAVDAVVTVLKVDQIIMSKQSGGPKMPEA